MLAIKKIQKLKENGIKIAALTAYDCSSAKFASEVGIDFILVGDSVGQVVMGYDTTTKVTMEEMEVFSRAVLNGAKDTLVVIDMPFLSYHTGIFEAAINAGKFIQMGAGAVKIEGANNYVINVIKHLVQSGIPVMGHLGFTPQYINTIGGNYVQGKNLDNTLKILNDAKRLEEAGVFSIVLEMVPDICAKYITENLSIPTIGIGAGKYTDGQILVMNDIIGKFDGFSPKFARKYANAKDLIKNAVIEYIDDVKNGSFPNCEECFQLKEEEYDKFITYTKNQ